ncbi:hypothetical protein AAE02nite_51330 [Adhaeribacter aerolatus]|uniref:Putative beta-lactamase-inhibitor-like PepSY-like domain-containing protein n=1 Tax=Adhaeribacter aerolatus TaxID=670289 RepID=A0A512B682_9BACT|nr:PepSY-like domain-containing protein [Adhaeribacter aerolatus]GEO07469.1 hypothetical protein AAE02nite_51330 [Adhaeribacter aerolatus]
MKAKSILFSVALGALFLTSCEKEEVVKDNELPTAAQEFLVRHFAGDNVAKVVKERDIIKKDDSYDVTLSSGTTLDFNKAGEITEIDSPTKLPDSFIPAGISSYVQTNYANDMIVGWELEGENQDIELVSQLELRFDKNNVFVSIQD